MFHLATRTNKVLWLNESSTSKKIAFSLEWWKEKSQHLKSIASNHGNEIIDSLSSISR